jgi:hypothetical protein
LAWSQALRGPEAKCAEQSPTVANWPRSLEQIVTPFRLLGHRAPDSLHKCADGHV